MTNLEVISLAGTITGLALRATPEAFADAAETPNLTATNRAGIACVAAFRSTLSYMLEEQPRRMNQRGGVIVALTEEERQAVLLALGECAAERMGWDHFLRDVAKRLGGAEMFETFRALHLERMKKEPKP